jgi:hypothetical protein
MDNSAVPNTAARPIRTSPTASRPQTILSDPGAGVQSVSIPDQSAETTGVPEHPGERQPRYRITGDIQSEPD